MSEEIAMAAADLARIDRLREQLNHYKAHAEEADAQLRRAALQLSTLRAVALAARMFATGADPDPDTPKARLRQALARYDEMNETARPE